METRLTGYGEPNWKFGMDLGEGGGEGFFSGTTGSSYSTITNLDPIATV